ncbi:MAG: chitobiase/beta-hexosaminidase C-terminal domain-containing protein [Ignavibacteriae bacterium]|nr:chitobiase/beta-hexosaminidase C-terminal domain-containing protein [Ignavibacteriota bacterium]
MKKFYIFILTVVMFSSAVIIAQIKLPSFISDNMVLQQNFDAPIWGWAEPGTQITINENWSNSKYETFADDKGKWQTIIKTPSAGGPYFLKINDKTISNILIGEVWICSGQSNMQWALSQTDNAEEEIANAVNDNIRLFYVARDNADCPNIDVYGKWEECSPKSASSFSAVAYHFGKELNKELNIPIGLIHTSWGGSSAQAWVNHNFLESTEEGRYYIEKYDEKIRNTDPGINPRNHQSPSSLYNGMLKPLIPFGIRGAIWYQGESNTGEHYMYKNLMETLITNWRTEWNQGDFPFYFVQIAPFNYQTEIIGAALRDAQRASLEIPNTGMAVTLDIGNQNDIHPTNKLDVGKRLSLWALANTYGKKDLVYSGPLYKRMEIDGKQIKLDFEHVGKGLVCKGEKLSHFIIAGKDKVFHPAEAYIENNTVIVSSKNVESPTAVRYAFNNGDEPNLFNKDGLPASTFRTDNWDILTEKATIISKFDPLTKEIFVEMKTNNDNVIKYTLDGSEPNESSPEYTTPVKIEKTSEIKTKVFVNNEPSSVTSASTIKKHLAVGKKVTYNNIYSQKYPGGNEYSLVNSLTGSKDFKDGNWQGFEGVDFEVIIDLEYQTKISTIDIDFLQNVGSWIILPTYVKIFSSSDGLSFKEINTIDNDIPISSSGDIKKTFDFTFNNLQTRYLKILAKSSGKLPGWHQGAGNDSWLFVDEIIIN